MVRGVCLYHIPGTNLLVVSLHLPALVPFSNCGGWLVPPLLV